MQGEVLVLFFDSATLSEHPTVTYVWSAKGVRPAVPTTGGHKSIKIFSVLNFLTGQVRHQEYTHYNSVTVIEFLTYVHTCFPNKRILLVWDNSRIHTSKMTNTYLQKNRDWLEIQWLPNYSHKLNPVEQLWRWLREKVTHNKYYKTFKQLCQAIKAFFRSIQRCPHQVLKRCKMKRK